MGEIELQARIEAEERRWAEISGQLQKQYQMEHGAHLGRMALLRELCEAAAAAASPPSNAG